MSDDPRIEAVAQIIADYVGFDAGPEMRTQAAEILAAADAVDPLRAPVVPPTDDTRCSRCGLMFPNSKGYCDWCGHRPARPTEPTDDGVCFCMGGTKGPCKDYPDRTYEDWAHIRPESSPKLTYDAEAHAGYIQLQPNTLSAWTTGYGASLNVDYASNGSIIGFEFILPAPTEPDEPTKEAGK